jgi:hypothetical protein
MIRRAILSTTLFIALGAAALVMAHAGGGSDVQSSAQRDAVQDALALRAAAR